MPGRRPRASWLEKELGLKALIVDDSRVMRSILKKFLSTEGFSTLLEAGANEYVMKPFTSEVLRDKLTIMGFVGGAHA